MADIDDLIPQIYHEKQMPGEMLCAQHALNSLLQGSYFSAADLSEIAHQLDEDERRELDAESRAATSTNMDDTGFFSVQVIQKALFDTFGLNLVPWEAEELRPYHAHPHTQLAFILNHSEHWYTLRRFGNVSSDPDPTLDPPGGHWLNLNSFNKTPERVSKLYLGMFLEQAKHEDYTVFAVVQHEREATLALPRVEVDAHFASLPDVPGSYSYSNTYSSRQSSSRPPVEGFEDEDMELQVALQASLSGGDYGEYVPQRFGSTSATSAPLRQLSRTASGVPVRRDYEVDEPEEIDDDEPMQVDEPQPLDPVAESMARQRAVMERMRRAQEYALREQYEDEATRIDALPGRQPVRTEDDEDEMLRRAIAESEVMARAHGSGSGSDSSSREEGAGSRGEQVSAVPSAPAPPAWQQHQHRVYDDDDQELQAALRASLETVPPGFQVPSPPPVAAPSTVTPRASPPAQVPQAPPPERQPSRSSDVETESEADPAERAQTEQLSMEEIRKRRLARFGG